MALSYEAQHSLSPGTSAIWEAILRDTARQRGETISPGMNVLLPGCPPLQFWEAKSGRDIERLIHAGSPTHEQAYLVVDSFGTPQNIYFTPGDKEIDYSAQGQKSALHLYSALDLAKQEFAKKAELYCVRLLFVESQQTYALWLHHPSPHIRSDFFVSLSDKNEDLDFSDLTEENILAELKSKNPAAYTPMIDPNYIGRMIARDASSQPPAVRHDFTHQASSLLTPLKTAKNLFITPVRNMIRRFFPSNEASN